MGRKKTAPQGAIDTILDPSGDGSTKVSHGWSGSPLEPVAPVFDGDAAPVAAGADAPTGDAARAPVDKARLFMKLPCTIGDTIVIEKAQASAKLMEDLETVESERADAMRGFKERISGIKDRMHELAKQIREHTEDRDIECCERLMPDNEVQIVRLDTGEIVERRTADAEDLQEALFDGDDDDDDGFPEGVDESFATPSTQGHAVPPEIAIDQPQALLDSWTEGENPRQVAP